jgi:histidinol-phosphate phosphatase family protein
MSLFASGPLRWRRTPVPRDEALPTRTPPPGRPAVFIDKDGTLIDNVPYNTDPALLAFKPGAFEALATLAAQGFALLVVTNQSGLARGYFTRAQFARLEAALEQQLLAGGVELLDFLVCPHAPAPDGSPSCLCRKPAPGLLLQAARRHRLDLSRSWMVGDTLDDIEAGHRAGCRTVLLSDGDEAAWQRTPLRRPDAQCHAWGEVADLIGLPAAEPSMP